MTKTIWTTLTVFCLLIAGCERADENGGSCPPDAPDGVYIDDPTVLAFLGETVPGIFCFDNGDGYPEIHPPITVPIEYPTIYPTVTPA